MRQPIKQPTIKQSIEYLYGNKREEKKPTTRNVSSTNQTIQTVYQTIQYLDYSSNESCNHSSNDSGGSDSGSCDF